MQLPERVWHRLQLRLGGLLRPDGAAQPVGGLQLRTSTWVNFKLFGGIGLMLLFTLAQGLFLARYLKDDAAPAEKLPADSR